MPMDHLLAPLWAAHVIYKLLLLQATPQDDWKRVVYTMANRLLMGVFLWEGRARLLLCLVLIHDVTDLVGTHVGLCLHAPRTNTAACVFLLVTWGVARLILLAALIVYGLCSLPTLWTAMPVTCIMVGLHVIWCVRFLRRSWWIYNRTSAVRPG